MHNKRFFKVLVFSVISISLLSGFKEKFSEKNQTGSPKIKKEDKAQVGPKVEKMPYDFEEEPLSLEVGPPSEDRKTFESWYKQLEDNIRSKATVKDRIEALGEGLLKIEKDRSRLQNLKFNEEIEIDFLIKPLKHLPKASQFDINHCSDYRMKILSHFDPAAGDEIKDPSLKKALTVFKLICAN